MKITQFHNCRQNLYECGMKLLGAVTRTKPYCLIAEFLLDNIISVGMLVLKENLIKDVVCSVSLLT